MSDKYRDMRLSAFRAFQPDDIDVSLQEIIEQLQRTLPNHTDRVSNGSSLFDHIALSEFKTAPANSAIGAVFSTFEEGAKASTLNFKHSSERLGQEEKAADDGEEFLGQNISILVEGNHVIACGIGNRAQLIIHTIFDLARKAGIIHTKSNARLAEVPHNPTVEDILKYGVKSVDLNITNFLASLPSRRKAGIVGKLFESVDGDTDHELRKSMIANLSIKKKKLTYESEAKDKWINELAIATMTEEEIPSYTIVLGNDVEISPKSMTLSKKVRIRRKASSFDLDDAHHSMIAYLRELKENGLLT